MAGLLSNFRNTFIVGLILAGVMIWAYSQGPQGTGEAFFVAVFRWMHVFFGILWIGLLYYFNFVQIRIMPAIPAELKPGVSKYIAPEALFWFRWAAAATVLFGLSVILLFGIAIGTYSSIYIAAPVIILWGVKRGGDDEAAEPLKPATVR